MPAYVIVETDVTDPEQYEHYKAAASDAVAAAGGRYLARGGGLGVRAGGREPPRPPVPGADSPPPAAPASVPPRVVRFDGVGRSLDERRPLDWGRSRPTPA